LDAVNINEARILKSKPIKPKINGRTLITNSQFDDNGGDDDVSFIDKPDAMRT
jgi:hypothetical protein